VEAEWVYYQLTAYKSSIAEHKRTYNFRADTNIATRSTSLADYRRKNIL